MSSLQPEQGRMGWIVGLVLVACSGGSSEQPHQSDTGVADTYNASDVHPTTDVDASYDSSSDEPPELVTPDSDPWVPPECYMNCPPGSGTGIPFM